jgi:siderophore synthetase component
MTQSWRRPYAAALRHTWRLSEQEARVLDELESHRPDLIAAFLRNRERGRRAILTRMLQATVRENIAGAGEKMTWMDGDRGFEIRLGDGRVLRATGVRRLSLGRFDVHGEISVVAGNSMVAVEDPCQLLGLLRQVGLVDEGDADGGKRYERFCLELDNSAANLALSFAGSELRRRSLRGLAKALDARSSVEYVSRMMALDPYFSPLAFYEQWVVEGHPTHPGARMKIGMDFLDVIENAPEWGAAPAVALAAVAKTSCRVFSQGSEGSAEMLLRQHPGLQEIVDATLGQVGKNRDDYELIPVHPWQFRHTIPRLHAEAIRRAEVILIPDAVIPTSALMSVRSLAPVQRQGEGKHHLKTAINVHMTSAVRTVSANAAANGPMLSRVLRQIHQRERRFLGRFAVLSEDVGVHYQPPDPAIDPQVAADQVKHLAAILRENPENYAAEGEFAMPAAALAAESPLGSEPVVGEMIDAFAELAGLEDPHAAAAEFIRRYAEISVPPLLTLMTRYGIALEGHMQNSVMVFSRGEPVRTLIRDLGAVRILPERLARQGVKLEIVPGSAILADDLDDLQNKVYYSFFQNHLAELIAAVVRSFEIDEQELWDKVARVARRSFAVLKADPEVRDQAAVDQEALFRPTLSVKALATMRFRGDVTDYTFRSVPNPLVLADPQVGGQSQS